MMPRAVPAATFDERILRLAAALGTRPGWHGAMRLASRLGDGPIWFAAGAMAALAGGDAGRRLALAGLLAGGLNALIYKACKRRFVRPRPFRALPDLPVIWSPPEDFSFPSGHTLHAFASATLIALCFPVMALPALLMAGWIGVSRVFLAVHYPSDVLAGALGGIVVATGIAAAL